MPPIIKHQKLLNREGIQVQAIGEIPVAGKMLESESPHEGEAQQHIGPKNRQTDLQVSQAEGAKQQCAEADEEDGARVGDHIAVQGEKHPGEEIKDQRRPGG